MVVLDGIMAVTKSLLVPTSSATATFPTSIPTIIPDPVIHEVASKSGERTLWVVFVIMALASLVFTGMSWSVPISKRLYHVVTTLIVVTASLSYFAMATGSGISINHIKVREQNDHVPDTYQEVHRQVYWARYVDWALTTPLLLLDLSLLAGLTGGHIFIAIVADIIMVLTGLFPAYGNEEAGSKWGWYTIACIAYLVVVWNLAVHGRSRAFAKGGSVSTLYTSIAGFTVIIWTAYPIVWGVADGARIFSVDAEIMSYAILDVLAKPIFGLWLLVAHSRTPETDIDVGGFWSHGFGSEGLLRIGEDDEGA